MFDLHTLEAYHYTLPEQLIAQHPGERGMSRLLCLKKETGHVTHHTFADIDTLLPPDAMLVANNSRVVPVRLLGRRPSGGKMECLLLSPLPLLEERAQQNSITNQRTVDAEVLLKPSKAMCKGTILVFGNENNKAEQLVIEVLAKGEFGHHQVRLYWHGSLRHFFETYGHLPLPPYIRRADTAEDAQRYQTVFSKNEKAGSAAAPTAGLHMTESLRQELIEKGFGWAEVTLHVGQGTFSPVRNTNILHHKMHSEYIECNTETAQTILQAKKDGRPIIALGTTACRTLEGIAAARGALEPFFGTTNIFIHPGYTFRMIDGLITNFHLPESTLLMLVCAFAGYQETLAAYKTAVQHQYRFFSYGDAMCII